MRESNGLFFAHRLLIILTWGAHKYSYIPGQFSALASIQYAVQYTAQYAVQYSCSILYNLY